MQIATRSGVPPSTIEQTWSIEEIEKAIALSRLECWGQTERMVARLSAAIHNAALLIKPNPNAKLLDERHFLPRKIKVKKTPRTVESQQAKVRKIVSNQLRSLSSLAGF